MRDCAIIGRMAISDTNIGRRVRRLSAMGPQVPQRDFSLWALAGLILSLLVGPALLPSLPVSAWILSASLYIVGAVLAGELLRRTYPHETLGVCNVVTLGRLVIVAGLVAPLAIAGASAWIVFTLASVALALDGADGWLARRNGRASDFGARFDVEVDSAFALVLSLHALDRVGPAVLVLGLARYAFVFAAVPFPWLKRPLPDRFGRKAVCVLQLSTLIVLQLPLLPGPAAAGLVAVASLALALSFGRDVVHLWRNRS